MSKKYNDFKFYAPPGVPEVLNEFCKKNHIFKYPECDMWKYIFIVSHIKTHSFNQKGCVVPCCLNILTLSKLLGTKNGETTQLVKNLVYLGIIKKVGSYEVGVRSASYLLCYNGVVFHSITAVEKYSKIPGKIIKRRNRVLYTMGNDLKMYQRYLRNITVEVPDGYFDISDPSINSIDNYYSSVTPKPLFSSSSSTDLDISSLSSPCSSISSSSYTTLMMGDFSYNSTVATGTKDSTEGYFTSKKVHSNIISLTAIQNGEWFVYRPDKKSRVHTNLTNLKSELRHFLRYDGSHFVELDIRNSQPLIASTIVKEYWQKRTKTIPADVIQYQNDCEAGTFYDFFMKLNNINQENRGEFKIRLFGEVFFAAVSKRSTRLKNQFTSKYPSVYEAICSIKGGLGSKTYNRFAIELQRKEASIIFDEVNMKLIREGIPAFNIFDSILCLKKDEDVAQSVLMEAFSKYGITPQINYKEYGYSNK